MSGFQFQQLTNCFTQGCVGGVLFFFLFFSFSVCSFFHVSLWSDNEHDDDDDDDEAGWCADGH